MGKAVVKPGRNNITPQKGQQRGIVDTIGVVKTPKNTPKTREKKKAMNQTPARGQSTILQYVSARKTINSAAGRLSPSPMSTTHLFTPHLRNDGWMIFMCN